MQSTNPLRRARDQAGFTFIELLVVMLVIGILAALALPVFAGQRQKANDTEAKSNLRNLVTVVQACHAGAENFLACDGDADELPVAEVMGLSLGSGPGQVRVSGAGDTWFEIAAISQAESSGTSHVFMLRKDLDGTQLRTCTAGAGDDRGGCNGGYW